MNNWSNKVDSFVAGRMRISGEEIPTKVGELFQGDLKFWVENPRIYSIVHASEEPLDQDEIQLELQGREHVKQLVQDIKHHGGLIHPIVVRDGDFSVLEGNSRLAAYRVLFQRSPQAYGRINCVVLPAGISEKLIYSYLNQEHMKGKSEWSPYEEAGIIFRLVSQGMSLEALASELNIGPRVAKRKYETYAFMVEHGEDIPSRWSYFDVYLQNRKIRKKREIEPTLDRRVIREIRSGKVTAQQFRDMLPEVCQDERSFQNFISERANLLGAYDKLRETGKTEDLAKLMKRIHQQIGELSREDFDGLTPRASKTVYGDMRQINRKLSALMLKVFGEQ